jgi:hypothetical protein
LPTLATSAAAACTRCSTLSCFAGAKLIWPLSGVWWCCCCVHNLLQALLADLALEDFLLNGAGGQQAVHVHALALAVSPHLQAQRHA